MWGEEERREGGKEGGRGDEGGMEHCSTYFIVSSVDGEQGVRPGMRGGHQMCIDPIRGKKTAASCPNLS